jgi:hypothetical protein
MCKVRVSASGHISWRWKVPRCLEPDPPTSSRETPDRSQIHKSAPTCALHAWPDALGGGTPVKVASGVIPLDFPLAVDDTSVYFVDGALSSGARIFKAAK